MLPEMVAFEQVDPHDLKDTLGNPSCQKCIQSCRFGLFIEHTRLSEVCVRKVIGGERGAFKDFYTLGSLHLT